MNRAAANTEATVVSSLIVTVPGALSPSTVISAMAGFSSPALLAAGLPPFATTYRTESFPGALSVLSAKRPSAPVRACASSFGAPALAAHSVTIELAIGAPPPSTRPFILSAAKAGPAKNTPETASVSTNRRTDRRPQTPAPRFIFLFLMTWHSRCSACGWRQKSLPNPAHAQLSAKQKQFEHAISGRSTRVDAGQGRRIRPADDNGQIQPPLSVPNPQPFPSSRGILASFSKRALRLRPNAQMTMAANEEHHMLDVQAHFDRESS